jgi:CheY-like chemotaxis protein
MAEPGVRRARLRSAGAVRRPASATSENLSRTRRIVVAEDDDAVRRVLVQALTFGGFRVEAASTGVEALVRIQQDHPDVVVLDLILPWLDGREILTRLREHPTFRTTPVLIVTGTPTSDDDLRSFAPVSLLRKPFTIDTLLTAVQHLMAGIAARQESD